MRPACLGLSWLLGEPEADDVRAVLEAADPVATSVLIRTEAAHGLLRAEQLCRLDPSQRGELRDLLERAEPRWLRMEVTPDVRARSETPFPAEPLLTLAALHLATIVEPLAAFSDLRVLTLDRRIADNARVLGMELCPAELAGGSR